MKTIYSVSVIAAALLFFASCQKENLVSENQQPVLRTITASFENAGTKTTLGVDDKPLWEIGDVIRLLDGSDYDDITLESGMINGGSVTLTTTLGGETLYAVYPASATTMTSCDGDIEFTIPAIQDGTFASANICVAKGDDKDNLVFRNATAVLEFSQTATDTKVLSIRVEAANAIVGPMSVSFNADGTLDTPTTSSLSGKLINAKSTEAKDKYYVAVAPVTTGKIEFEFQKAVEVATVTTDAGKTLAVNKIYACSMDGKEYNIKTGTIYGHDYVQVGSVKWATRNVGATTVAGNYTNCYGDLYEWGSVETIYTGFPWTSATDGTFNFISGKTDGYSWTTYCGSSSFVEWDPVPYDATNILKSEKDAATQNWGTGWRMPTSEEFYALYVACGKTGTSCTPTSDGTTTTTTTTIAQGIYWCTNYNGVAGLLFITKDNGPHLFFPAAGRGNAKKLDSAGSHCYYWSSSLGSSDYQAYRLDFRNSKVFPQSIYSRYYGCSVRPVSD